MQCIDLLKYNVDKIVFTSFAWNDASEQNICRHSVVTTGRRKRNISKMTRFQIKMTISRVDCIAVGEHSTAEQRRYKIRETVFCTEKSSGHLWFVKKCFKKIKRQEKHSVRMISWLCDRVRLYYCFSAESVLQKLVKQTYSIDNWFSSFCTPAVYGKRCSSSLE